MRLLRPYAVAALLVGATARGAAAQHDLATLPLADPAYRQLDGLSRLGCRAARVSPFRPYQLKHVRSAVSRAAEEPGCQGVLLESLRQRFGTVTQADTGAALRAGGALEVRVTGLRNGDFHPYWRDAVSTDDGTPPVVALLRGRVAWSGGSRLVAVTEVFGQTNTRNDPRNRALPLRETSGILDFSEAYLNGAIGPFTLSFGRSQEAWLGRGEESLILSAHGPPIDRVAAMARWSQWEARAIFATLDRVTLDPVTDGPDVGLEPRNMYRMLAGHALAYRPWTWLELTLGETALIGRRGPTVDLAYANPLMLYLITEHDQDREFENNQNNLFAFGGLRAALGSAAIETELHIDDIQIDGMDRRVIPDQLAWRVAVMAPLPLAMPVSGGVEYRRVDSFTYQRSSYHTVYQRYDAPIGSELGPDADWLRMDVEGWLSGRLRVAADVSRWRRGAQRIDQRPAEGAVGHAGEPYPSVTPTRPSPQSAWIVGIAVEQLRATLPIELRAEVARFDDLNNAPETPATHARVSIVGTYRFRYP